MIETFIVDENRIFAPVHVGQTGGYAHVDTGARHSSILQAYAGPFPDAGSRERRGAFATISVPQVHLDEVRFLGQTFRDVLADVQPNWVGGLGILPFDVTMSLGCDLLLQKPLHLNFERGELAFLDDAESEADAGVRLGADFSLSFPLFELSLGDRTLAAGFDTGAALCVLNQRLLDSFRGELTEDELLAVEDATGARCTLPTYRSDRFTVGGQPLDECQFLVIDVGAIERKVGRQIDFIFGANAMLGRNWVLDRRRACIEMLIKE